MMQRFLRFLPLFIVILSLVSGQKALAEYLNIDYVDIDRDGVMNANDPDIDGDGVSNEADRLPFVTDSVYCEPYKTGMICLYDNCPGVYNIFQEDGDHDGVGDICDSAPAVPNPRYDHNCDGKITSSSPQEVSMLDENFVEFFSATPCEHLPEPQAVADNEGAVEPAQEQQEQEEAPAAPDPSPAGFDGNRKIVRQRAAPAVAAKEGGSGSNSCMNLGATAITSMGLWEIVCSPGTLVVLFLILIRLSLPTRKRRPGKNFSKSGR